MTPLSEEMQIFFSYLCPITWVHREAAVSTFENANDMNGLEEAKGNSA